jgi:hypothetical protein
MNEVMRELREAVMILVEASFENQGGTSQTVPARMEDRSAGGACIRVRTRIAVGSQLRIQWRWEQFSGIAKSCRKEGNEYLVGIQRNTTNTPIPKRPVPTDVPLQEGVRSADPPVSTVKKESLPERQESKPSEILVAMPKVEGPLIARIANCTTAMPTRGVGQEIHNRDRPSISQLQHLDALRRAELRWAELQTTELPKPKEAGTERKHMQRKWLGLANWHNQQDGLSGSGNGNSNGKGEKESHAPEMAPPADKTPADPLGTSVVSLQAELLPMDDIYRAAGIINPRKGYSISKVVEMLASEHIRGAAKDMRRAAVLMALDAAGIPIDQVQQDAKARKDALDSYEAEQRKRVEAEWARKAEENIQIQAELDRVKALYMARISRNLEGVAQEKDAFNGWLTMKQQETQSISDAAELCLESTVSGPANALLSDVSMVAASAKPVMPSRAIPVKDSFNHVEAH